MLHGSFLDCTLDSSKRDTRQPVLDEHGSGGPGASVCCTSITILSDAVAIEPRYGRLPCTACPPVFAATGSGRIGCAAPSDTTGADTMQRDSGTLSLPHRRSVQASFHDGGMEPSCALSFPTEGHMHFRAEEGEMESFAQRLTRVWAYARLVVLFAVAMPLCTAEAQPELTIRDIQCTTNAMKRDPLRLFSSSAYSVFSACSAFCGLSFLCLLWSVVCGLDIEGHFPYNVVIISSDSPRRQ